MHVKFNDVPGGLFSDWVAVDISPKPSGIRSHHSVSVPAATALKGMGGAGPMGGAVVVGRGDERPQHIATAEKQSGYFDRIYSSYDSLCSSIGGIFNYRSREDKAEASFKTCHHAMVAALEQPVARNSLAMNGPVMDRLLQHAQEMGNPIDKDTLRNLVAAGENIARTLRDANDPASRQRLENGDGLIYTRNGQSFEVKSGLYTTRALSWYIAANAALQDADPKRPGDAYGNLPYNGAYILKDPDHKIYTFLKQAPGCAGRISTHVNDRSATTETHRFLGCVPSSYIVQQGIEDYNSKLPGQGGAVLFDKLVNEELYVKFEVAGCPAFLGHREPHEEAVGLGRIFHAAGRNLMHAFSFLQTRSVKAPADNVRQEHVHKGRLKEPIFDPFKKLVAEVVRQDVDVPGLLPANGDVDAKVKSIGLSYVQGFVDKIAQWSQSSGQQDSDIARMGRSLGAAIVDEQRKLGGAEFNIKRQGAEVHTDIYRFA